jgi:hypothetical protein
MIDDMTSVGRSILVAALLAGFSASGWMRQCCAAGCRARPAAQDKAAAAGLESPACCDGCRGTPAAAAPAEPEPRCPFGDECRDEARRSQGNPPAPGEDRCGAEEVPAAPVERAGPVSRVPDGRPNIPAVCDPPAALSVLFRTARLRN